MKTLSFAAALVLALFAPLTALAAEDVQGTRTQAAQSGSAHKLHGVVNSVNEDAGIVNITHDPVASLKWPKMKMNFKAQDPKLLRDIKPGMTVDFEIETRGYDYRLTRITPVK
jgi:Cu/Ag efflux protein CusF